MKKDISKFDELVIGALRDDVFEEIELEERSEDSSKTGWFAISGNNAYLDMFIRVHIPIKKALLVISSLVGVIALIIKLNPAMLHAIQDLLAVK